MTPSERHTNTHHNEYAAPAVSPHVDGRRAAHRSENCSRRVSKEECPHTRAVLECLKRHGHSIDGVRAIKGWLSKAGSLEATTVHNLARVVDQWRRDTGHEPRLSSLLQLSAATGIALDDLVGLRTVRADSARVSHSVAPAPEKTGDWIRDYLAQAQSLSCYVVFVSQDDVPTWRAEADELRRRPQAEQAESIIALATKWAQAICVTDASAKLRRECGFSPDQRLGSQTMWSLLQRRLEWIADTNDKEKGARLADLARQEALNGVWDAVCGDKRIGYNSRFPCVRPLGEEGRREVVSLRVSFDTLPRDARGLGWIVYYHWGPPLSSDMIDVLLQPR